MLEPRASEIELEAQVVGRWKADGFEILGIRLVQCELAATYSLCRIEHGIAIGWGNMEFAKHGWADETNPRYGENADVLARPQGRFKFAGDHTTFMPGWQEGAVLGAWEAVKYLDRQVNPTSNRG